MKNLFKILMAMTLIGGTSACAQKQADGYNVMGPQQFAQAINTDSNGYILDVRTPQEYADGNIEGSHNLDWLNQKEFKALAKNLPQNSTIYVYCRSGKRSAAAAQYLQSLGYKVIDLDGGYMAWERYSQK